MSVFYYWPFVLVFLFFVFTNHCELKKKQREKNKAFFIFFIIFSARFIFKSKILFSLKLIQLIEGFVQKNQRTKNYLARDAYSVDSESRFDHCLDPITAIKWTGKRLKTLNTPGLHYNSCLR